jgi:hypothetical protein
MPGSTRPFWHVLTVVTVGILWLTAGAGTTFAAVTTQPSPAEPTSQPTPAATQEATPQATLTTCDHSAVTTPANYLLACADGTLWLASLHWSGWDSPTATARGTLWRNDCTPNCANGQYLPYHASVSVSGLSGDRYTRMHVTAPQAPGGPFDYVIGPNGPQ